MASLALRTHSLRTHLYDRNAYRSCTCNLSCATSLNASLFFKSNKNTIYNLQTAYRRLSSPAWAAGPQSHKGHRSRPPWFPQKLRMSQAQIAAMMAIEDDPVQCVLLKADGTTIEVRCCPRPAPAPSVLSQCDSPPAVCVAWVVGWGPLLCSDARHNGGGGGLHRSLST